MRKLLSFVLTFITTGVFIIPQPAISQTDFRERARQKEERWNRLRTEAESIAVLKNMPIRVERADGSTFELQRFENGRPRYYATDNLNAAKTISTNKVWSGGGFGYSLTGSGVLLGEWDGGEVLNTHQEYVGRVTSTQGTPNFHSTHVAGTMIGTGINAAARGMASQATLNAFDFNNDESEMITQAGLGLKISNHSYGLITGWRFDYFGDSRWAWFGDTAVSAVEDYSFGFYDSEAQSWDNIALNAPYYLIMKSAGNDRDEGPGGSTNHWVFINGNWVLRTAFRSNDGNSGYDCISAAGLSKNVMTVGAVNDISLGYSVPASVTMSSFSSWGPADDGRIKPDIVANGVNLTSSLETSNTAYGVLSGTSMATPNATGSIGLLLQHQQNLHGASPLRSSTWKALVINTADEAGANPGPDYVFGWGLMNTLKAAQLMTLDSADGANSHIMEMLLTQGDTIEFDISMDGTDPLKATICWTDPAGTPVAAALDPTNIMLRNDLDLRIIRKSDNTIYEPWILNVASPSSPATTGDNIRDNVEQVYVQSLPEAQYAVRITHKGGTLVGASQYVSIVISGNVPSIGPVVSVNPESVDVQLIPNGFIQDSIKIKNIGDALLTYEADISPTGLWLSILHSDSGGLGPQDSVYLGYRIDAAALPQWTDYAGSITITGGDDPVVIPVELHVTGPKIIATPAYFPIDVDSGATGLDTLKIKNDGFTPLAFTITDTSGSLPVWLTLSSDNGVLSPNDSALIVLTTNAISQPVGNYSTVIEIANNDSSTGDILTQVDLHVGTRNEFDVSVNSLWNLVSVPVIPFTYYKNALFPTATTPAYSFDGTNYDTADTLENGLGYWMKFASGQTITIDGYTFAEETVDVHIGWNIVGSLASSVASGSINSIPSNIITSGFFSYNPGYTMSDSIHPGKGYWVQTNQAGQIIFSTSPVIEPKVSAGKALSSLNTLTIEDVGGNRQTLYFGDVSGLGITKELFVMPPPAPSGSFDARFASGKMLESFSGSKNEGREFAVNIQPVSTSITLRWTLQSSDKQIYTLRDENGVIYPLDQKGSVKLTFENKKAKVMTLSSGGKELPKEYSLSQNFPNPFNPATKIQFELPEPGNVTIKVYNILGNEVATIVNGVQEAGYHSVEFDGAELPSGVYIYRMQSGKFSSMKKMMLLR